MVKMSSAAMLPLFFLFITQANAFWVPVSWNSWPSFTSFPSFPSFPSFRPWGGWGGWGGCDWWCSLENIFNSRNKTGTSINIKNGSTTVTATIGGHRYTATFPGVTSVSTSTYYVNNNGTSTEEFKIKVNGTTYVYSTAGGKTNVTYGNGTAVAEDPFNVTSNNGDGNAVDNDSSNVTSN
ncbi:hypothetical protein GCK32_012566 [Trichostrongylus colubriformis]|uniref:Uncharacterized protein n=1 Tax=Trichostrongylus colubriformis TaxID=6319 RepID=A0AAN8FIN5_TRICO